MAGPTLDLDQAKRLMGALYEPGDCFYALAYHDADTGRRPFQKRLTHDAGWSAGAFITSADNAGLAVATSVGVFEPETPVRRTRRTEDQCVGLSAFGIDIDRDDLAALVPGATTVAEVIPEVVRRLEAAGIPPHALVRSGRGLHVYLLIERARFGSDEDRTRAKDMWYRLTQLLGGASDRFDLSSVLRVPGTLNRKGEPVRVEFVEEHTHLDRPRHAMEAVARGVAHLPAMPGGKAVGRKRKSIKKVMGEAAPDTTRPARDPWDQHVLGVALRLDASLAKARQISMEAPTPKEGKPDRSKNDFRYASRLLELGMGEDLVRAEVGASAKGQESGDSYADSTFRSAVEKVYPTKQPVVSASWVTARTGPAFLSTEVEKPAEAEAQELLAAHSRGESPPSTPTPIRASKVAVECIRPGAGKTRAIVNWLANRTGLPTGRVGLCGSMVTELLRHEHAINSLYPFGFSARINFVDYDFDADLPGTPERLWERLPEKLKRRVDDKNLALNAAGKFQPLWTIEKVKAVVTDPDAFFINSRHPRDLDQALEPYEDGPDHWVFPGGGETPDPIFGEQPRAVLKFRGRADLCLANRPVKQLRAHKTCRSCDFAACRANVRMGGSKTYWTDAPFPLLTHKAYETHALVRPEDNEFDALVVDELPVMVYRYPKLQVAPLKVRNGRAVGWEVKPFDDVVVAIQDRLAEVDTSKPKGAALKEAAEAALAHLGDARDGLMKKASDLMHKALAGKLGRKMVQVDRFAPLLGLAAFEALVKASRIDPDDEPNSEDDEAVDLDLGLKLLRDLWVMHDFCGDVEVDVFMEADFDRDGEGSFRVCRPVNGWPDLLNRPGGAPRDATLLLDATAGIDPRYLLAGHAAVEDVPDGEFPNTTLVLTSKKAVTKKRLQAAGMFEVAEALVGHVAPYLDQMVDPAYPHPRPRLLVVTAKLDKAALEKALAPFQDGGKLPAEVHIEHFGGLRGRNDYRDFDAVYFTHVYRLPGDYYYGLELLLRDFGEPFDRQWVATDTWFKKHSVALLHRAEVADIYQDALRIGIRSDPARRAFIFVPTSEAGLVVRLLRLFRGARLVLPDGEEVHSPLGVDGCCQGADGPPSHAHREKPPPQKGCRGFTTRLPGEPEPGGADATADARPPPTTAPVDDWRAAERRSREPLKSLLALGFDEVHAEAIIEHMRDDRAQLDPLRNPGDAGIVISVVKTFIDGGLSVPFDVLDALGVDWRQLGRPPG